MRQQIKIFTAILISILMSAGALAACGGAATPTPTPLPAGSPPAPTLPPPPALPTYTPVSLNDPLLLPFKEQLADALRSQDPTALQRTASFTKWVGAIYREGGTPPIDPRRGLTLTLNFLKENKLTVDPARTTYEPNWNTAIGDTSMLGLVTPADGEPYYAHFYVQREPSAWRYVGLMTRVPYYDSPTVAQLRADPEAYDGKEYMYVGTYHPKGNAPGEAGPAPENATYVLDTFAGPLWVVQKVGDSLVPLPSDVESHAGEMVRVFGTVKLENDVPYLEVDSLEFIEPDSWGHTTGVVESVDPNDLQATIRPSDDGASVLQLTPTSFVSLPDGTRGSPADIEAGQTIDATGVPQPDGSLLVEALYIAN